MSNNNNHNNGPVVPPELASILATLAQFAPPPASGHNTTQVPSQYQSTTTLPLLATDAYTLPTLGYNTNHIQSQVQSNTPPLPAINAYPPPYQQPYEAYAPTLPSERLPLSTPQGRSTPVEKLIIDPAAITEWSAGLRCVSKLAVQNRLFGETIRRMINDQRKHEMQWYSSRQTLKQTQAKRSAGANEIHSILKSVTGQAPSFPSTSTAQSEAEKAAELASYDQKVYRAQSAMQGAMTAELKSLGVPFFGTNADRLLADDTDDADPGRNDGQPKWSPRITDAELLTLQRKMIAYLEDMYKE
ncbi:hypothetical protein MBLNU459_g7589t1 [Dothideomycetes sp. NU459]